MSTTSKAMEMSQPDTIRPGEPRRPALELDLSPAGLRGRYDAADEFEGDEDDAVD